MKVSVIVPLYNGSPETLERCFNSLAQQTVPPFEVIVVDDGSTTPIARQVPTQLVCPHANPSVTVPVQLLTHPENRGLSAARNTGIDAAQGDYVFFLDSDDSLPPHALRDLTATAAAYPGAQLIQGNVKVLPTHNKALNIKVPAHLYYLSTEMESAQAILYRQIPVMACNKLLQRRFLLYYNLYFEEGLVHEDVLWSYRVAQQIARLAVCRTVTYHYYQHPESLSQKDLTPNHIKSYRTIVARMSESMPSCNDLLPAMGSYLIFTSATFLCTLFDRHHPQRRSVRQYIRRHLLPLQPVCRKMVRPYPQLYRALFLPTQWLCRAKRIRNYF